MVDMEHGWGLAFSSLNVERLMNIGLHPQSYLKHMREVNLTL
jgi:hypothetical protein